MCLLHSFLTVLEEQKVDVPYLTDLVTIAEKCPYFTTTDITESAVKEWSDVFL